MVQIFIHDGKKKRGSWTSPRQVLSLDPVAGTVTVPGRAGKTVTAAVEYARAAPNECDLTNSIQDAIDQLESNLSDNLEVNVDTQLGNEEIVQQAKEDTTSSSEPSGDFVGCSELKTPLPVTGDRIAVHWPLDHQFSSGTIQSVNDDGTR